MGRIIKLLFLSLLIVPLLTSCASTGANSEDKEISEEIDQEFEDAAVDEKGVGDEESTEEEESDEDDEVAEEDEDFDDDVEDDFEEEEGEEEELAENSEPVEESVEAEPELEEEESVEIVEEKLQEQQLEPQETVMQPPVEPKPKEVAGPPVDIKNISFLANDFGGSVVIETSGQSAYSTRINAQNQQIVVEVSNAHLPNRLRRPYITKDFKGEFASINAYQTPGSSTARVVVQMKGNNMPDVIADGNSILVLPAGTDPATVSQKGGKNSTSPTEFTEGDLQSYDTQRAQQDQNILKAQSLDEFLTSSNKFYGRRISIETGKEADIRDVISTIADQSGVNLVMSEDVKGTIQIKLRDVPWDQALVIILRAKKLGYLRQGNVLRISTLNTLHEEARSSKQVLESRKTISPLVVKVIPISFADVEAIKKHAELFLSKGRGSISADKRTNSIIVKDTQEQMTKVITLVKELDIPPLQVMIEGKFIEATKNFVKVFGMSLSTSGTATLSDSGGANGAPIDMTQAFNFKHGASALGRFQIGVRNLDLLGNIDAALSLEESKNNIKVISSPRVVTMNREKAEIEQSGEVIRNKTIVNAEGKTETDPQPVKYSLKMEVTPQVTSNGNVIMDVNVKREFPGFQDTQGNQGIEARAAKTKTMVKNGQTAVIGGIFQEDQQLQHSGIPVLKDIPVIGWLFKFERDSKVKTELLVFLTPRIIEDENIQPLDLSNTIGLKVKADPLSLDGSQADSGDDGDDFEAELE